MKKQIFQLTAFIIFVTGILALVLLTGAMISKSIDGWSYLFLMLVTCIVMFADAKWIDRNFVDGEWI